MILTVDIGNTNIKVGAWDKEELVFVGRLQTNILRTRDEYAIDMLQIFRLNDSNPSQFDGAILSSVVPPLSLPMKEAVQMVIQSKRVFLVSPGLKTGLDIKIDNPATLGGDMVCAAVAALEKYTPPLIIVSLGTATAMFAVGEDGGFLGGSVSPGVGVSLEALSMRTSQLPHISLDKPASVIGSNTVDSIKSGAIYGTASMLDGMIDRMAEELHGKPFVVACGGIAPYVAGYCLHDIRVDENLVLEGLRSIYHKNARK